MDSIDLNVNQEVITTSEYYFGFAGKMIKIETLWRPLGKYEMVPVNNGGQGPQAVARKLISREGLNITVKTVDGSFQQIRVPCTIALWDNIEENRIYRYHDDTIYLKFDENGIAVDFLLESKTNPFDRDIVPDETGALEKGSRIPRVKDLLLKKKQLQQSFESSRNAFGNTAIFKADISEGNAGEVSLKYMSSELKADDMERVGKELSGKLKASGVAVKDIVAGEYIVTDVRDNGEYIHISKLP